MPTPDRQRLVERMHLLLVRELGEGLDARRMLDEPLYARDVLFVCDALRGTELQTLARQFRDATEALDDPITQPPSRWPDQNTDSPAATLQPRAWFRGGRWLRR